MTSTRLFAPVPIFRDLDAVLDTHAVSLVMASGIAVVLAPNMAARQVTMTGSGFDRVARKGAVGRWIADRSCACL